MTEAVYTAPRTPTGRPACSALYKLYLLRVRLKSRNGLFGFARPQLRLEAAAAAAVGGAEVLHHLATGADVKVGRPVDVGGAPRLSW